MSLEPEDPDVVPEPAGFRGVDISVFKGKMSPQERKDLIAQSFPSTATLNWGNVLSSDDDLLGGILRDILEIGQIVPGRGAGRRPGLDQSRAEPVLDEMRGLDPTDHPYSSLTFSESLRLLQGGRSLRSLETKTAIPKTRLHRLLSGAEEPRIPEMEHIAKVFGKQPAYFLEYRVRSITSAVYGNLSGKPEVSINIYERMWHAASKKT